MKTNRSLMAAQQTNTTLITLMNEAMHLAQQIVEARGEITPELEEQLTVSEKSLAQKTDAYVAIDERLEAEAAYFKRKADEFSRIAKAFSAAQDRLRERVLFVLGESGKQEIKGAEYRWKRVACKKRLVINEEVLPVDFKMVVTTQVPDKEKIKIALSEGFPIAGVSEEGGFYVRPFENSEEK